MTYINSEIKKYYWQDFSLHRVIGMPAFIVAVIVLICLIAEPHNRVEAVSIFALISSCALLFFWGGQSAANAILEEIKENTWDTQRLSAVSSWQLTLGKLFGSTLYAWYGALILLTVYILTALQETPGVLVLYNALLLVVCALFCHSIALLCSLQSTKEAHRNNRVKTISYFFFSAFIGLGSFLAGRESITDLVIKERSFLVHWFDLQIQLAFFIPITLLIFLFWGLVAVYRNMRETLKYRNLPWVWGAFLIFLMVYISGFIGKQGFYSVELKTLIPRLGVATLIALVSGYYMLFSESLGITRYRALLHRLSDKKWFPAFALMPGWVISFVIALVTSLIFIVSVAGTKAFSDVLFFMLSLYLFVFRDICLVHYFAFSPNNRRAVLTTVFYFFVLYSLLPAIALTVEKGLYPIFYPTPEGGNILTLLAVLAQAIIVAILLKGRYRKISREIDTV